MLLQEANIAVSRCVHRGKLVWVNSFGNFIDLIRPLAIVKLFLRYASQEPNDPWITATGWLIAPDLIVTAGHSAFDWFYKMGRLTQVKAYVGYNGRASAEDPTSSVQFRQGNQVATTAEWLRSRGVRAYNLAFIKVHQPFTGIVPVKFQDTPRTGRSSLGVVGYAGEIADQSTGEKGARMYESFSNTRWNLEDSEYSMLEYEIDSYGGKLSESHDCPKYC